MAENNLPKKALLLVDNCSAHGSSVEPIQSDDGQICVYFLPPNVTSVLQPMDQGPICITKLKYRQKLLENVFCKMTENPDLSIFDALRLHTIKDAIIFMKDVWDKISDDSLKKAWKPLLHRDDENVNMIDEEDDDETVLSEMSEYAAAIQMSRTLLNRMFPNAVFSLDEIENWNEDKVEESDGNFSSSDDESMDEMEIQPEKKCNIPMHSLM